MVSEADLFERVRLLRDVSGHSAGEECTLTDFLGHYVMLEFEDDWGVAATPSDLEPIDAVTSAA